MIPALAYEAALKQSPIPHDGIPANVWSNVSWLTGPRIWAGINPPYGFTGLLGWAQCMREAGQDLFGPRTLFIKDMQTWVTVNGVQQQLQDDQIYGMQFDPNFRTAGVKIKGGVIRGIDGVYKIEWSPGSAFHWWHTNRTAIPPGKLQEIFVACQVRVEGQPQLIGCGCDYKRTGDLDAVLSSVPGVDVQDAAVGKLVRVADQWTWIALRVA